MSTHTAESVRLEAGHAADMRLAVALGVWAREEIGLGFKQFQSRDRNVIVRMPDGKFLTYEHEAHGCDGPRKQGYVSYPRHSLESAARALVERVVHGLVIFDITPETHALVWRSTPEFDIAGVHERMIAGYARFCFVKFPEGAGILDCEPMG